MRRLSTSTWLVCVSLATLQLSAAAASDLVWEVESPFRFFKKTSAFALHEKAYDGVRGKPDTPVPANIVWRTERRLNDPDCTDKSSPGRCYDTKRAGYERSRLGWAAQTLESVCYDRNSRPFRYMGVCERQYSWGTAKEDYVLPEAHTVAVTLSPERLAEAGAGECTFSWLPRAGAGKGETIKQPCKKQFVIKRVPFSPDTKVSGATVKVTLPDGRELSENVVVEDVLVVAIGNSFMSGESNPDKPVSFSPSREMVYDPIIANSRDQFASRGSTDKAFKSNAFGLASTDSAFDEKSLPRRRMDDEAKGLIYRPNSSEFQAAFDKRRRAVALGRLPPLAVRLSVPRRHQHGAGEPASRRDTGERRLLRRGRDRPVHGSRRARARGRKGRRQGAAATRPARRPDLPRRCQGPHPGRELHAADLQIRQHQHLGPDSRQAMVPAGKPQARRSTSCCCRSAATTSDLARSRFMRPSRTRAILRRSQALVGGEIRFGPDVSNAYLAVLDKRIKAVRDALVDGFGVEPSRVLQNAYEPIQFDETGSYCGNQATLGMDVHPRSRSTRRGWAKLPMSPASCRSGLPAWRAVGPAARRVWRPAPAPASASSPITSPTSPSAASVRATRPAR